MIDYTDTTLHFKLGTEIGSEGMNSRVFCAHDHQLDANIVVKQIKKAAFVDKNEFFDEAKILYASVHSNIVPIQYATQDAEHIYISMPFYKNGSLNALIEKRHLSIKEIIKYSLDFLSGLHHIHCLNLIHFDVKPTNILLSDNGDAVLTDFGLSRSLNIAGVAEIDKVYSMHQAPEVIQNAEATHQTDIYQAGLTIYRLCNGNEFFKNQTAKYSGDFDKFAQDIIKGKFPDRNCREYIPKAIKKVIKKAIEPDPDDRYESVLEMMNDLANIEVPYNWIYQPNSGSRVWQCDCEDRILQINLESKASNIYEVITTKTLKYSGNTQKMTSYCQNNVNIATAETLINNILHNKNL